MFWGPARRLAVAGNKYDTSLLYAPVEGFLAEHAARPVRVEVPLARLLGGGAARPHGLAGPRLGEAARHPLRSRPAHTRTDGCYGRWPLAQAVGYVALRMRPSIRRAPRRAASSAPGVPESAPGLRQLAPSMRSCRPPARVGSRQADVLGARLLGLYASSAGKFLVRVHFSRYLTIIRGWLALGAGPEGGAAVTVATPARQRSRALLAAGHWASGAPATWPQGGGWLRCRGGPGRRLPRRSEASPLSAR